MAAVLRDIKQEMASLRSQSSAPSISLAPPSRMPMRNPWSHHPPSSTPTIASNGTSPTVYHRPWSIQNSNITPPRPPPRCCGCGKVGHFRRDCPANGGQRPASRSEQQQSAPAHVGGATGKDSTETHSYLRVSFGGKTHLCLLDTGCEVTLIPAKMVDPRATSEGSSNNFWRRMEPRFQSWSRQHWMLTSARI